MEGKFCSAPTAGYAVFPSLAPEARMMAQNKQQQVRATGKVSVPHPSGDQAPSGWGTRALWDWVGGRTTARTNNCKCNPRSFDCAPRDETARGFAQDDKFVGHLDLWRGERRSHPSRETKARRMGHPGFVGLGWGEQRQEQATASAAAGLSTAPLAMRLRGASLKMTNLWGIWICGGGERRSHPSRETKALRMGHPGFVGSGKESGRALPDTPPYLR